MSDAETTDFEATMRAYAETAGWTLGDVSDRRAVFQFTMESGRQQTCFVLRYDATLEFSVPTIAAFDTDDEIPHPVSTILLKRSAESKIGFWCIEHVSEKMVYSVMHNHDSGHLTPELFRKIVVRLISEADLFEGMLIKMFSSPEVN